METRCFIPPDSSWGRAFLKSESPTSSTSPSRYSRFSSRGIFLILRGKAMFSKTVFQGRSTAFWKTKPMSLRP